MKLAIIDYSIGNVQSISNALAYTQEELEIIVTSDKKIILDSDAVILPGVGAYQRAMRELDKRKLPQILSEYISSGKPLLGICLGMQLLLDSSDEFGHADGLSISEGLVKKFPITIQDKLPHVSWNNLIINESNLDNNILNGITADDDFYFVHSYICHPKSSDAILATTSYGGGGFCSVFQHNNIYGCQFHPEKSASQGLRILNNFIDIASK